jgi:hypothetical protein
MSSSIRAAMVIEVPAQGAKLVASAFDAGGGSRAESSSCQLLGRRWK